MSSYRKTMGEVYNGMYLVEGNIDKIKDIVSKKSASKIDGVTVDLFTASAISQIYDKVNDANKKKMEKLPITKLAALAMKMMKNEYVPEELDLDEAIPTSSAYALVIQQKDGSREIVAKGSKEKMKTAAKKYGGLKQGKVFISLTGKKVGDKILGIGEEVSLMSAVEEQLAKIKGNTPGDQGRRGAVEDDIERAEKKGDKKLVKKLKEDDLDEGRGRPRKDGTTGGSEDRENIQMQLRKSVSLRGLKGVEFADGNKVKVPAKVAQGVMSKINSIKDAKQKQNAVQHIAKSHKHMMDFHKGDYKDADAKRQDILKLK